MNYQHRRSRFQPDLLRAAAVTFGVAILSFLALDDITTDRASSFILERAMLAAAGAAFCVLAWWLWHRGSRFLGTVSFVFVAAAGLAQRTIGPGTRPGQFDYIATLSALVWFVVLAGVLTIRAWRPGRGGGASG